MAIQIGYKSLKIYKFGTKTEGDASMKEVLGGKGANLAEMASLGLPVPSGFTIPCSASVRYAALQGEAGKLAVFQASLWEQVDRGLKYLESSFGYMPLVSVRSGSRVSMPGMMDTILNVGLTSETLPFWTEKIGARAALDSYRRLIQMYGSVAMGVPMERFENELEEVKAANGFANDAEITPDKLARLVESFKSIVLDHAGQPFPDTLETQLKGAISAVFRSWNNERAIEYRKINNIPDNWGTAVNVQGMVFGNMNDDSATGVLFSRDPSTGENVITGEFLVNAQGEDVVAGIRTPEPLTALPEWDLAISTQLFEMVAKLEAHYKDMQDIEFTVQDSKLYLLQTRNGKRSALAAFQIAHDMAIAGLITKADALKRVTQAQLLSAMSDQIDPAFQQKPDVVGIAAGGGVVSGIAVFTAQDAVNCKVPCILVRKETDPDDIAGMNAAVGILTATGGLTSHAAVVARGMNKSCVVGATGMDVNVMQVLHSGKKITIDGSTGNVWIGIDVPVVSAANNPAIKAIVSWAAGDGIVERVTLSNRLTAQEVQSKVAALTGRVHIDTATFDDASTKAMMDAVGAGLALSKVDAVYIDAKGLDSHLGKSDFVFDWMFGISYTPSVQATCKYQAMLLWSDEVLAKTILLKAGAEDSSLIAKLVDRGVKVSGKIATFADLLNANGPMEIDPEVVSKVFGSSEAYESAKSMVEQATGKSLSGQAVKPVYWYEFLTQEKEAA